MLEHDMIKYEESLSSIKVHEVGDPLVRDRSVLVHGSLNEIFDHYSRT